MQEQGIVRRIDELGRLVIPKELRKSLRIREGDPLEIYASKDELVLKKYSPISSLKNISSAVADGIENLTEKTCIITDCDTVVYVSSGKDKDILGKNISTEMEKVLKERKSVVLSRADGGTIIPVISGEDMQSENQIIVPMITGGDCFGSVILYDKDKSSRFSSSDVKLVQLGSSFLSSQLE
ncbi:MAG: AbrB/MazE/SpoVT family DNA-binding domain-containing protein [Clostridiales bacterium]|nr:AbrB/MazE/SpoVT family DNA-binding domain-containing protein [Clostridiales bacterium]